MTISNFTDRLSFLCAMELSEARGNHDRMGIMIERLSASLGLTIAIASAGNAESLDDLMIGAEGYIHAEAVAQMPLVRFMVNK